MLNIQLGTDWVANRDYMLNQLRQDVAAERGNRILLVPELISHSMERFLCSWAGDTASRFAEVLSFRRLESRISEEQKVGTLECMDNGGRLVAMALAARNLHSRIKVYAGMETKPEFLTELLNTVDELKQCCITGSDLRYAAEHTEGSFSQKLSDLSMLMEMYDGICIQGKRDPRDRMNWVLEQLKESRYGEEHTVYIDGFPDFTRQHMRILEYFIETSPEVTINLCCDAPASHKSGFEKAGSTAASLITYAGKHNIPVHFTVIPPRKSPLSDIYPHVLSGDISPRPECADRIRFFSCNSVYAECSLVLEDIIAHAHKGERYRDHSIACTDMGSYRPVLELLAAQYGVPLYLSGTEDILKKPVIVTLLSAMEAALGDLEQKDVLRYLKSSLSPIDMETCDKIENYAVIWGIRGNKWNTPWENHPQGLDAPWTQEDRDYLDELNTARKLAVDPLWRLRTGIRDAMNIRQQVDVLNRFLEEIHFCQRLQEMAESREKNGDFRSAQIFNQLWEIILKALEQLYDTLGDASWDTTNFPRLLSLLLSQYSVGTIPSVLDSVAVGSVGDMRGHASNHLYVLGAREGNMPRFGISGGLLSDKERIALRKIGIPISGAALDKLQAELSDIYCLFCGAEESITVCNSGGEAAAIARRLAELSCGEKPIPMIHGAAISNREEAGIYLAGVQAKETADFFGLTQAYSEAEARRDYSLGNISPLRVEKLYGKQLRLSASQIDRMATCQLSYFLQYGLRAKKRQEITIDPTSFGSYVHDVLENTAKKVMELGGFHEVSLEATLELAEQFSEIYVQEHFSQLDSKRITHLLNRNRQEVLLVVRELWEELSQSEFRPVGFEVGFGEGEEMSPVRITSHSMQAILRGFVDRVDVYEKGNQHYFRVVDYKTGGKDFDYCDVYNGVGLQMLLYLFALRTGGQKIVGNDPMVGGVQYFPAKVDVLSCQASLSEEEAAKERQKKWKRSGLLLKDDEILLAMENLPKPQRMQYSRNKDGVLSGNLAERGQWDLLEKYLGQYLGELVDTIASGSVQANPYTRDDMHNPCRYCPYDGVCHSESISGRRTFRKMEAAEFWDELERKVNRNG